MAAHPLDPAELPSLHAGAVANTQRIVDALGSEVLGAPTPCGDWDVTDLVHHLVYGNLWVSPLVAGETIDEVGDRFEGDILGDDISGAFRDSAALAVAAFAAPAAMEALCPVSYGPVPGSVYCGHRFVDVLVHGWDLAAAADLGPALPADLVEACIEVVLPQAEMLAGSGLFGSGADPGPAADQQRRLLTLLGRAV